MTVRPLEEAAAALPGQATRDRVFYSVNAVVSAAALGVLAWILMLRTPSEDTRALAFMPAVNATLNTISATCLTAGWFAIRRKRRVLHRNSMTGALIASACFLAGYLAYHYLHGDTRYAGDPALRPIYLAILASHVILSIAALPMVITTFWFAWTGNFSRHRRIARWTLPIWLYVSVTGVIVFLMLRSASS